MADDDRDDLEHDDLKNHDMRQNSRACLAELALERALTPDTRRALDEDRIRCVILEVPSASYVGLIVNVAMETLGSNFCLVSGGDESKRRFLQDGSASMATDREPIIAVSHAPERLLHPAIVAACDLRVTIKPPDACMLSELSSRCLREAIDEKFFEELSIQALDFDELCSCFPLDASSTLAMERLSAAIARKSGSRLDDVPTLETAHGYGAAQRWANDLRTDLQDHRLGRISIDDVDVGCVLFGPSGTGKSLFARIVAKACSLPIVVASVGELFATSKGDLGAVVQAMRAVFAEARRVRPSLLFLDELDALPNRATMDARGRDWWVPVITDFLTLLDSAMSDRDGIVVLGATNHLEHVDAALLRPGRLERAIWIGPPDATSLAGVLHHYLGSDLADVDLVPLTTVRLGSTGAEAEEWARAARRRARRAGRQMVLADLEAVVLPLDPRSSVEKERASIHEAGHALLSLLLDVDTVERVTIQRTEKSGGHTAFIRRVPEFSTKAEIGDRVTVLLGGRAAEELLLGSASSAAGGDAASDLALATNLILLAHSALGLGDQLVWRGLPDQTLSLGLADAVLRSAVNDELVRLMGRASALLQSNKSTLTAVAKAIEMNQTITGDELRALVAA